MLKITENWLKYPVFQANKIVPIKKLRRPIRFGCFITNVILECSQGRRNCRGTGGDLMFLRIWQLKILLRMILISCENAKDIAWSLFASTHKRSRSYQKTHADCRWKCPLKTLFLPLPPTCLFVVLVPLDVVAVCKFKGKWQQKFLSCRLNETKQYIEVVTYFD